MQTGPANAVGNVSETAISQQGGSAGGGIYIGDQEADVDNVGVASANTGGNTAVGNNSTNTATSTQDADASLGFGSGDDATAANQATNTNASDGTASVQTGPASAVGNVSETDIDQHSDAGYESFDHADDGYDADPMWDDAPELDELDMEL